MTSCSIQQLSEADYQCLVKRFTPSCSCWGKKCHHLQSQCNREPQCSSTHYRAEGPPLCPAGVLLGFESLFSLIPDSYNYTRPP